MLGLPILVSWQEGDFRYVKCGCCTCSQQIEWATANYVSFCDSIHAPTAMALAKKTKNKKTGGEQPTLGTSALGQIDLFGVIQTNQLPTIQM